MVRSRVALFVGASNVAQQCSIQHDGHDAEKDSQALVFGEGDPRKTYEKRCAGYHPAEAGEEARTLPL